MGPIEIANNLRDRGGLKWTFHREGVLGAWVAEMDFGLAPTISEALHDAVSRGDTAYPYPALSDAASLAATGFWSERFGWQVESDRVFPVPDVLVGLKRSIVHLTKPGSAVVVHTHVYYPFFGAIEDTGRSVFEVPGRVDSDGRYTIDLDGVASAFEAGAGSIVLCNPWNPTGRVLTSDEIDQVLDVANAHDARVIADEIHAALIYDGAEHVVAAARAPETVITITSASKAWNLPGLKCAHVVLGNSKDRTVWESHFTGDKVGVGTFGLIANREAYTSATGWLDEVIDRLHSNRTLLGDLVKALLPRVVHRAPEGTFLAWLDFRDHRIDQPAEFFLEHADVALTEGAPFRGDGAGHARLNFATSPEILTEIVERMAAAL
jgi:cystathionine beta-lyase